MRAGLDPFTPQLNQNENPDSYIISNNKRPKQRNLPSFSFTQPL